MALILAATVVLAGCTSSAPRVCEGGPACSGGHMPRLPFSKAFSVVALSFPDPAHGAALVQDVAAEGQPGSDAPETVTETVRITSDGGARWRQGGVLGTFPLPGARPPPSSPVGASHLTFADAATGWAWGPGLYKTSDGGRTWRQETLTAGITDLAVGNGALWVLEDSVSPVLLVGPTGGTTLTTAPTQPPVPPRTPAPSESPGPTAQLVPISPGSLGILSPGRPSLPARIETTSDGARSWSMRTDPCPASYADYQNLRADVGGDLWLACGSSPGANSQPAQLWRLPDGAGHWRQEPPFGPYGQVTPVTASVAWLTSNRGVLRTTDGGAAWHPLFDPRPDQGLGIGAFAAVDATHAWATVDLSPTPAQAEVVYRTSDAVHWEGTPVGQ